MINMVVFSSLLIAFVGILVCPTDAFLSPFRAASLAAQCRKVAVLPKETSSIIITNNMVSIPSYRSVRLYQEKSPMQKEKDEGQYFESEVIS